MAVPVVFAVGWEQVGSDITLNGRVCARCNPTTVHFEYGPTVDLGISTATQTLGGSGSLIVDVAGTVSDMPPGLYYWRMVATNRSGTAVTSGDDTFEIVFNDPTIQPPTPEPEPEPDPEEEEEPDPPPAPDPEEPPTVTFIVDSDGGVNAANYGALPGTECNAAFQTFRGSSFPKSAFLKLSAGTYSITQICDFYTGVKDSVHTDHLWIKGAGCDSVLGTTIRGSVNGPLIAMNRTGVDAATTVILEGIHFINDHPSGTAVQLERIDFGHITNCNFTGARGLVIGEIQQTNVDINLIDCRFDGDLTAFPTGIGLAAGFKGALRGCSAFRYGTCAWRLSGHIDIYGAHIEVCPGIGIQTGLAPDGSVSNLPSSGSWHGLTIENVGTAVSLEKETYRQSIRMFSVHNPSAYGLRHKAGARSLILENAFVDGTVTGAAYEFAGAGPIYLNDVNEGVTGTAYIDTMPTLTITGVTNAAFTTVTTSAAHDLDVGHIVRIASVGGATGVNGRWAVHSVPSTTTFVLSLSAAPGVYTSGGTVSGAQQTFVKTDYFD